MYSSLSICRAKWDIWHVYQGPNSRLANRKLRSNFENHWKIRSCFSKNCEACLSYHSKIARVQANAWGLSLMHFWTCLKITLEWRLATEPMRLFCLACFLIKIISGVNQRVSSKTEKIKIYFQDLRVQLVSSKGFCLLARLIMLKAFGMGIYSILIFTLICFDHNIKLLQALVTPSETDMFCQKSWKHVVTQWQVRHLTKALRFETWLSFWTVTSTLPAVHFRVWLSRKLCKNGSVI